MEAQIAGGGSVGQLGIPWRSSPLCVAENALVLATDG